MIVIVKAKASSLLWLLQAENMTEALPKKKKIRCGHQASATRMVNRVSEVINAFEADPTTELDINVLLQLKPSLEEKLSTLKQ